MFGSKKNERESRMNCTLTPIPNYILEKKPIYLSNRETIIKILIHNFLIYKFSIFETFISCLALE